MSFDLAGAGALEITKRGNCVTSALIEALHHAQTDENEYIRVSDLAAHVQDLVPKLAAGGEAVTGEAIGSLISERCLTSNRPPYR